MNALVIFKENEWRDLISFYLHGHFGMQTKGVSSEDDAILELVRKDIQYDTVVCGPFLNAERILWCILAEGHRLELILNTDPELKRDFPFRGKNWIHFVPGFDLISSLEMVMLGGPESSSDEDEWVPIKTRLLLYCSPAPGNIYLKKNQSVTQWLHGGSRIHADELDRMAKDPQIAGFFVQRSKCNDFALGIQDSLLKRYEKARIVQIPEANLPEEAQKENRLDYLKKRLEFLKNESRELEELTEKKNPK